MRLAAMLWCAVLAVSVAVAPASAEKRVALVIGNSAYQSVPELKNPKNDAEDVGATLRDLDFEVIVGTDLDRAGMNAVLDRFSRAADGADIALIFYAGHGMQYAGANYLLPVDARLESAADVNRFRLLPLDDVLETLRPVRGARLVILDACRNNPVEEELKRRLASIPGASRDAMLTRGLGRISVNGLLVAYATQANDVASDGIGRNSPFTSAFLKNVVLPDIDVRQMFFRVQDEVDRVTASKQRPELSISLIGEFKLKISAAPVAPVTPGETAPPVAQVPLVDPAEREWNAIKDTASIAMLEEFIRQHGGSLYERYARARVEELKKAQVAVVVPPVAPPISPPVEPSPPPAQPTVEAFDQMRQPVPLLPVEERTLKAKDSFKECDSCPEVVVMPAGSFTMGSPDYEPGRSSIEGPQHRVTIAKPYAAGKFEVTVDEFAVFVKETGHDAGSLCWTFEGDKGDERSGRSWRNPGYAQTGLHPVACVNWNDAKAYVAWLSRKTGKTYRLLSEFEREYMARAGTTTPFWWGSSISPKQANYDGTSIYGNGPKGDFRQGTVAVDSFQPNPWGLYQVHGNLWEWTEDCWNSSYSGAPSDGSARTNGNCNRRILRGGSWYSEPASLRSAKRDATAVDYRSSIRGFRVARTLTP